MVGNMKALALFVTLLPVVAPVLGAAEARPHPQADPLHAVQNHQHHSHLAKRQGNGLLSELLGPSRNTGSGNSDRNRQSSSSEERGRSRTQDSGRNSQSDSGRDESSDRTRNQGDRDRDSQRDRDRDSGRTRQTGGGNRGLVGGALDTVDDTLGGGTRNPSSSAQGNTGNDDRGSGSGTQSSSGNSGQGESGSQQSGSGGSSIVDGLTGTGTVDELLGNGGSNDGSTQRGTQGGESNENQGAQENQPGSGTATQGGGGSNVVDNLLNNVGGVVSGVASPITGGNDNNNNENTDLGSGSGQSGSQSGEGEGDGTNNENAGSDASKGILGGVASAVEGVVSNVASPISGITDPLLGGDENGSGGADDQNDDNLNPGGTNTQGAGITADPTATTGSGNGGLLDGAGNLINDVTSVLPTGIIGGNQDGNGDTGTDDEDDDSLLGTGGVVENLLTDVGNVLQPTPTSGGGSGFDDDDDNGLIDNILDPVTSIVNPIVTDVVNPIVTDVVNPIVTDVVDPIVTDVVDPIFTDVVDPIFTDVVDPIFTDVVDPIVTDAVNPIVTDVFEPVTSIVDDLTRPTPGPDFGDDDDDDGPTGIIPGIIGGVSSVLTGPSRLIDDIVNTIGDVGTDILTGLPITDLPITDILTDLPSIRPTDLPNFPDDVIGSTGIITDILPTNNPLPSDNILTDLLPGSSSPIVGNPAPTQQPDDRPVVTPAPVPSDSAGSGGSSTESDGRGSVFRVPPSVEPSKDNYATPAPPAPTEQKTKKPQWFGTVLPTYAPPPRSTGSKGQIARPSIASNVPKAISPAQRPPKIPDNYVLVHVGFDYWLNYNFVVGNHTAQAQIIDCTPSGLGDAIKAEVKMKNLVPMTLADCEYITTLANCYVPEDMVDLLQLQIRNPNSTLYNHPDPLVKTLMSHIDPTIPLRAGSDYDGKDKGLSSQNGNSPGDGASWLQNGDSLVDGEKGSGSGNGGNHDGAPIGASDSARNPVTVKSLAIGVCSVGAAAIYGVAMFFLARRYRRNRMNHQRASSLSGGGIVPEMVQNSPGVMTPLMASRAGARSPTGSAGAGAVAAAGGKRGSNGSKTGSARGQISAPMMSENSLGWN